MNIFLGCVPSLRFTILAVQLTTMKGKHLGETRNPNIPNSFSIIAWKTLNLESASDFFRKYTHIFLEKSSTKFKKYLSVDVVGNYAGSYWHNAPSPTLHFLSKLCPFWKLLCVACLPHMPHTYFSSFWIFGNPSTILYLVNKERCWKLTCPDSIPLKFGVTKNCCCWCYFHC